MKEYIDFISTCKTERECIEHISNTLTSHGFRKDDMSADKVLVTNNGKALLALHKPNGTSCTDGINFVCAHVDSPRLDIKMTPAVSHDKICYLDTHYYGGIRKYQWLTIPLAMHGVIFKKGNKEVRISVGEKEDEPVFYISDLLPHLAQDDAKKASSEFVKGEQLDVIIGNNRTEDSDDDYMKKLIADGLDIDVDDFMRGELEIVPAGRARYVGFDSRLVAGYGHDDRSCAYAAMKAFIASENTDRWTALLLVDKEEIGSVGATGMDSMLIENMLAQTGVPRENMYDILMNSAMLSADVCSAFDPTFSHVFTKNSCAYLGKGVALCKYTGSRGKSGANDANAEFVAKLLDIFDEHDVKYQMAELGKVDVGGGGTIAYLAAKYGMDVIDAGIPVMSMHAPMEIIDATDFESAVNMYKSFYTHFK